MAHAVLTSMASDPAPPAWCLAASSSWCPSRERTGTRDDFLYWQGASGRRYVFSTFPSAGCADLAEPLHYDDCVVLVVARRPDGSRRILHAADTGSLPGLVYAGATFRRALQRADEVHLHFLADSAAERAAVIADLLRG